MSQAIYPARRAAERCVEVPDVAPVRLFATLFPLWRVTIRAQVDDAQPYDLVDRFVERAIADCGIDSAERLAGFLGLERSFLDRVLHFLDLIGHIEWHGERVVLTDRGYRSLRAGSRLVRKEGRQQLLFDAFRISPLPREYYAGDVMVLREPRYKGQDSITFQALSGVFGPGFQPDALRRLVERPDRDRYNVPHALKDTEILDVNRVYLPVYLVEVLRDGRPRFLAFSQVAGERDQLIEHLVAELPDISRVLAAEEQQQPETLWRDWLRRRSLPTTTTLARLPNGLWRATLPGNQFGDGRTFHQFRLGSFEVSRRYFLQLWCDDPAARRLTVLERALSLLKGKDITTGRDLAGRLGSLSWQLEVDPVRVAELRRYAVSTGQHDRAARIDALD